MNSPPPADNDAPDVHWVQQRLFPPTVVEVVLRVGWVAETGHLQWQCEVFDPNTRELFAMQSVPHRSCRSAQDAGQQALTGLLSLFLEAVDPEPF